ncbi:hypothetical protein F5Y17DRAFT_459448 [Xylariaceae sp. FL0594]|nr:hypothetical protein F5Y17DRAFT_459448 [Xylariaceae sp. FL0594]
MKAAILLASFILGITAAPISPSPAISDAIISSFSASTNEGGPGASISFGVDIPGTVSRTHCAYKDTTSGEKLPDVSAADSACDDSRVTWQFRQDPTRPGAEGITGSSSPSGPTSPSPSDITSGSPPTSRWMRRPARPSIRARPTLLSSWIFD